MVSLLILVKGNKFLLLKRSEDDHAFSGFWGLPGGHVEKNESIEEGLKREIEEELGISIKNFFLLTKDFSENNEIFVFVSNDLNLEYNQIILNEEHTNFGFFNLFEIQSLSKVIPSTIKYIIEYLKNTKNIQES
jgi:8-oxo-dGTP pyrophosphatase MutT (NUDIX family)